MSEGPLQQSSRYAPVQQTIDILIRIKRGDKWYQMRPLNCSYKRAVTIVERLKRKGRAVEFTWFEGMGLGLE